ncbi:PIG-L family deacetylase [Pseudomonadota bacterium]|nr:PIG-L family deacetylase [Pseudomonadota bacterium]
MKTLILSPHIDDEVLGCGGLIDERVKSGGQVFVQFFGIEDFHEISKDGRLNEVKDVSSFLGFDYDIFSNEVNNYNTKLLVDQITDLINEMKPDEIFIPNRAYNQDHTAVNDAAFIALRPHDRNHFIEKVYEYEVDQYRVWGRFEFKPNFFIAIDINKKVNAYLLHASQVRDMRPPKMLEEFAAIRGYSINEPYAEGFNIVRFSNKSE